MSLPPILHVVGVTSPFLGVYTPHIGSYYMCYNGHVTNLVVHANSLHKTCHDLPE